MALYLLTLVRPSDVLNASNRPLQRGWGFKTLCFGTNKTVVVIASRKRCGDLNEFTLFLFTKIASSDVGIETQDYFYDGYSQSGKALRDAVPFAVHLRNYLKRSCAELKVHFQFFHLYTLLSV